MHLFEALALAGVTLKNRIVVSPMCQYSAENGLPTTWHMVHLGSRAVGGAGLVFTEATAVEERGRISPGDTGIWSDGHAEAWTPIAKFITDSGAVPGMQLAHAGRKASTAVPWKGGKGLGLEEGGWRPTLAPSALAFASDYPTPAAMTADDIDDVVAAFAAAARRAVHAGFQVLEIHGAHGYLIHEFLSPLSNQRTDEYGGSFDNRIRFVRRVIGAVREAVPSSVALALRISATDWADGGWELEDSVKLVEAIANDGIAFVDVSSGGNVTRPNVTVGHGYQTPLAAEIKRRTGMATATVGMITSPEQADHVIRTGQADLVCLARELLRDPNWPLRAAKTLGHKVEPPVQYTRAWPSPG